LMVALGPGLQCGDGADDTLFADFHTASDAAVLKIGGPHQGFAAGHDAGCRPAEEFVRGVERDVGAGSDKAFQIVFGGAVDDHRNALGMGDGDKFFELIMPYCWVWCETTNSAAVVRALMAAANW